jgi:hypothetical protein
VQPRVGAQSRPHVQQRRARGESALSAALKRKSILSRGGQSNPGRKDSRFGDGLGCPSPNREYPWQQAPGDHLQTMSRRHRRRRGRQTSRTRPGRALAERRQGWHVRREGELTKSRQTLGGVTVPGPASSISKVVQRRARHGPVCRVHAARWSPRRETLAHRYRIRSGDGNARDRRGGLAGEPCRILRHSRTVDLRRIRLRSMTEPRESTAR